MNSSLDSYSTMVSDLQSFLDKVKGEYNFETYKFLGDGYILLFHNSVGPEKIYEFSEELVDIGGKILSIYIEKHIQNSDLPRQGITIGVDSGILDKSKDEYIGRPINIACRLQGKLDSTDSVNRIIISKRVFSKIEDIAIRGLFKYKPKTLKNVNGGKPVPCYESTPLVSDKGKSIIVKKGRKVGSVYYTPSAGATIEAIDANSKFGIQIRRNNGKVIYRKDDYSNPKEVRKIIGNIHKETEVGKTKIVKIYRKSSIE